MNFACTTEKYDLLYARWLADPGRLLDLADWQPGQRLLDLCGGTGAVTREALQRGASPDSITLLDLNPRLPDLSVRTVAGQAERVGFLLDGEWTTYDVIVCRQAFSYLDLTGLSRINFPASVAALLKPSGKFVFNTFVRPKWSAKRYTYDGQSYFEVSGYFGRTVWHLQASPGLGWDVSRFHWFTEAEIRNLLARWFRVEVNKSDTSIRWVCTKR